MPIRVNMTIVDDPRRIDCRICQIVWESPPERSYSIIEDEVYYGLRGSKLTYEELINKKEMCEPESRDLKENLSREEILGSEIIPDDEESCLGEYKVEFCKKDPIKRKILKKIISKKIRVSKKICLQKWKKRCRYKRTMMKGRHQHKSDWDKMHKVKVKISSHDKYTEVKGVLNEVTPRTGEFEKEFEGELEEKFEKDAEDSSNVLKSEKNKKELSQKPMRDDEKIY